MKKVLSIIVILNITISGYSQKIINPDGNFKYSIPYKNETGTDLLKSMQKINPLIIDIHIIKTKNGNIPLALSKYEGGENLPLEIILEKYVNSVKSTNNSRVLETKTYNKNGIIFHRKITAIKFNKNNETISVMYYFKESKETKNMYELKISSDIADSTDIKNYLEKVASTVTFKK
jgi:hypothetical protein